MGISTVGWTPAARDAGRRMLDAWQKVARNHQGATGTAPAIAAEDALAAARVVQVQEKREAELLALANVVGVASSLKVKKNQPTDERSLTVFVREKKPASRLAKADVVPPKLDEVPTDVVEVGDLEALVFSARVRPALPGYSIGHHNITAGTFGCLVRDIRGCCQPQAGDGDYLILSNNHVLADTNRASPGDLILQPGPFDGGVFPADGVATLERLEPIVFGQSGYNLVDAAVARPPHSRNAVAAIIGQVVPRGIDQAFVGSRVLKVGRTTQVTTGVVLATNATVLVGFGAAGTAQFRQQIVTTAMAAGGDSGSLLMDAELNAIGLLFAGSAIITLHNHIAEVEAALGARPLTAPRAG